jgi:hypothetical protein
MKTHEDLKAYVDGELNAELSAELESQLKIDPELDREARFLRAIGEEIRGLAVPLTPVGAEKSLRVVRMSVWQRLSPVKWQIAGLGAISVVALVGLAMSSIFATPSQSAQNFKPATADLAKSAEAANSVTMKEPARGGGGQPSAEMLEDKTYARERGESLASPAAPTAGNMEPEYRNDSRRIIDSMGGKSASGMTTSEAHEYLRPKLIRNSDLEIKVTSAFEAHDSFQRTVRDWDGFVLSANVNTMENTTRATLQVRVPEGRFEEALLALRKMGQVLRENSTGEDVTAKVIDSRTRVEVLADEESNLIKRLAAARTDQQRAMIRYELTRIRMELQSWKAQAKALDEQTKYSTLDVSFVSDGSAVGSGRFGETWSNATGALGGVGTTLGQMLIYVGVFSPVWLPLVLIGWLVFRRRV